MEYHWSNILVSHNACSEALTWAKTQPTAEVAWSQCRRADWMLWIAARLCVDIEQRQKVVFAACQCAREALPFVPKHEKRVLECILVTEAWTRGEVTLDKVIDARRSAYASATAAAYAAASAAYSVAAHAAAASAAYSAASAASSAAHYADARAAAYTARAETLSKMADIVREHLSMPNVTQPA